MVTKISRKENGQKGQGENRYLLPVKRPLGLILTDGTFISPDTLNAALAEQMRTNKLLGDILVDLGALDRAELEVALWVQRDFSTVQGAIWAAAGVRRMLGELLLKARRITQDQLDFALAEQKRAGGKLGEVMVRLGFLNQREIDVVLSFQDRLGKGKIPSCLSLGELLVSAGYITNEHLQDALNRQRGSKKRLGEMLVDSSYASQHHIDHCLSIQEKLVAAALIAALSLAPVAEVVAAQSSTQAMSTKIAVSARVLARASMQVLRQPAEIVVTDADIRRGFLDVDAGSLIEIRNNSRAGVHITFESQGLPFRETMIRGFGREVALGPNGGIITQQITGTSVVALNYRFIFDKFSQPGTYAWPLAISVNPVE